MSGVISEITATGRVAIEGGKVEFMSYVADDNYSSGAAPTDEQGRYRMPGFWSGSEVYTGSGSKGGLSHRSTREPVLRPLFPHLEITAIPVLDIQLERLPDAGGMSARTFHSTSRVR